METMNTTTKLDTADRWTALVSAYYRRRSHGWKRNTQGLVSAACIARARRVAEVRGQVNAWGVRPCSDRFPCWFHSAEGIAKLATNTHLPPLTGVLSCGRVAPVVR